MEGARDAEDVEANATNVEDYGPGTEWHEELDGYTVSMVAVSADTDLTELLRGLPNDQCSMSALGCRHAGQHVVPPRRR